MRLNSISAGLSALVITALGAPSAFAGYTNYGGVGAIDYTLLPTAWTMGGGTRSTAGPAAPGSASWSVMAAGLADGSGFDPHSGAFTSALDALYAGGVDEVTTISQAINSWASVSGFINLGLVADGGGSFGAAGAAGGTGSIRVGAIFIDGAFGSNVLAHAYQPGEEGAFGPGGNIAGDMHFDDANLWSDDGTPGTIDFHTVALHELGHALGLGHSTVTGSVMEAFYGGSRRSLTADDIAGIQRIYGPIPEPATSAMMLVGALSLLGAAKKRSAKQATAA